MATAVAALAGVAMGCCLKDLAFMQRMTTIPRPDGEGTTARRTNSTAVAGAEETEDSLSSSSDSSSALSTDQNSERPERNRRHGIQGITERAMWIVRQATESLLLLRGRRSLLRAQESGASEILRPGTLLVLWTALAGYYALCGGKNDRSSGRRITLASSTTTSRDVLLLGGIGLLLWQQHGGNQKNESTGAPSPPPPEPPPLPTRKNHYSQSADYSLSTNPSSTIGANSTNDNKTDEVTTGTKATLDRISADEAPTSAATTTTSNNNGNINNNNNNKVEPQQSAAASHHIVNLKAATTIFRPPPRPTTPSFLPPAPGSSVAIPKSTPANPRYLDHRYLEILVHNVSHTDLVLGLDEKDCAKSYARPRFSTFDELSDLVLTHLHDGGTSAEDQIVSFPRHVRSASGPRYAICLECNANGENGGTFANNSHTSTNDDNPDMMMFPMTPTGLKLARLATLSSTATSQDIRIRESDEETILQAFATSTVSIAHVFFPLLATLLPVWRNVVEAREYKREVKRVLILVTGVGTPRNRNHSLTGNSTEKCATLMAAFLRKVDPKLVVVQIHSTTNVFRYDENLTFVETELMPIINAYRDAHATGSPYPDEEQAQTTNGTGGTTSARVVSPKVFEDGDAWRNTLHVILSSADGSPARTHAIQASLRPYRPTYFHFWQLKTFWHESKIVEDDVEVHSFETMETLPPKDADRVDDVQLQLVVREMKSYHQEVRSLLLTNDNDLHRFWLRKTHKPVLAVLLVHMEGDSEPRLFRGTNMEVSMPTGSLCAERNAIGSALSTYPDLKRHDLKMIAVLAVPPEDNQAEGMTRNFSSASFVEETDAERRMVRSRKPSISSECDQSYEDWMASLPNDVDGTPVRRIQLHSKSNKNRSKRTVVVHSSKDKNPLPPCGACNEWLKKIAETNPYFKIITFTDANCNGVYITPCQT